MDLEKMEELYKSGDWVCLVDVGKGWEKTRLPLFIDKYKYQIIHKKHEHILNAYIDNTGIEIEWKNNARDFWSIFNDGFIETYNANCEYRLQTTQQEINEVIDKQLAEESGTIKLNGGGLFIKEFASKHFEENKTYEITIKEVISNN